MTINTSPDPRDWNVGDYFVYKLDKNRYICGPCPKILFVDYYNELRIDYEDTPGNHYWDNISKSCWDITGLHRLAPKQLDFLTCCKQSVTTPTPEVGKTPYTIDIPGWQDIIRIPSLEDAKLIKERIERARTHLSPLPRAFDWIPGVLNWLDDIQDFLFVALAAGWPILKRLPLRILGPIGWILTGLQFIDAINGLLGLTMGGRHSKRKTLASTLPLLTKRAARLAVASKFLGKFPWVPFIAQGLQVSREWTGYGLQLGGVMGLISESIYGAVRAIQGNDVIIRPPPPSDLASKAARVLAQSLQLPYVQGVLSDDDMTLVIVGTSVASEVLRNSMSNTYLNSRGPGVREMPLPGFAPWNPTTRQALLDNGWQNYEPEKIPSGQLVPSEHPFPPVGDVLQDIPRAILPFEQAVAEQFGKTWHGLISGSIWNQMAKDTIDWAEGPLNSLKLFLEPEEQSVGHAIEYNIFPPRETTTEEIVRWSDGARQYAKGAGKISAGPGDLKRSAIEVWGGYRQHPIDNNPE
jgi:hypothetical protein